MRGCPSHTSCHIGYVIKNDGNSTFKTHITEYSAKSLSEDNTILFQLIDL